MIVFNFLIRRDAYANHARSISHGTRRVWGGNAVKFFGFFKKGQETVHNISLGLCICFLQKNVRVHDPLNHFSGLLAGYTGKRDGTECKIPETLG